MPLKAAVTSIRGPIKLFCKGVGSQVMKTLSNRSATPSSAILEVIPEFELLLSEWVALLQVLIFYLIIEVSVKILLSFRKLNWNWRTKSTKKSSEMLVMMCGTGTGQLACTWLLRLAMVWCWSGTRRLPFSSNWALNTKLVPVCLFLK